MNHVCKLSPQQKKRYSYQKDCRNDYGENAKSSRKNIPRSKRHGHKNERCVATTLLSTLKTADDERQLAETLDKFKDKVKAKCLKRFKKCPDLPLGKLIKRRVKRQLALMPTKTP